MFSISLTDQTRLLHIRDSVAKAISLLSSSTLESFLADEVLTLAIEHLIEMVGEGSRVISPSIREAFPKVEWIEAARIRHKIAHDYLDIDLVVVWKVVKNNFPRFLEEIEDAISQLGLSNSER